MKAFRIVIVALLLAAVVALAFWWRSAPEPVGPTLTPAKISEIESMVQLSTLDIYEEVPVKGSVGKRHLVGRMALEGNIAFDVDRLDTEMRGDTLVVTLPPEVVTLRESTAPNSYTVIDSWNDQPLSTTRFTAAEENVLKQKAVDSALKRIYTKGYVSQARADAVASLTQLLTALMSTPVLVVDPTPSGTPQ